MMAPIEDLRAPEKQIRMQAALALGREPIEGASHALIAQLTLESDTAVAAACCVALELIDDKSVANALIERLKKCPADHVWDIGHALGCLLRFEALVPLGADAELRRRSWLTAIEQNERAKVTAVRDDSDYVRFCIESSRGNIRFDYAPPAIGTVNWPRWNRSLLVNGTPLYDVGSTCGTCETMLRSLRWPEASAFEFAQKMSSAMQDEVKPTVALIKEWSPFLSELQTGHYFAASLCLAVERVSTAKESWMTLRQSLRSWDEAFDGPREIFESWPGVEHFQGPTFDGALRTFWLLLTSQAISKLNEARVEHYAAKIRAGQRPTILTLGWMEDRYVQAEWNERFVILCVLDGHHKLEAYSRCAIKAHVITLFQLENTWGPRDDPSRPLINAIEQLKNEKGKLGVDVIQDDN